MIVHTARISYTGRDRLDISRAGNDPLGVAFAPSWDLLNAAKSGAIHWGEYRDRYTEEMRASYRDTREAWDRLLALDEVTLCCYCRAGDPCHRLILATIIVQLCDRRGIECGYQLERIGAGKQSELFDHSRGADR
jgi:hypothetical protein